MLVCWNCCEDLYPTPAHPLERGGSKNSLDGSNVHRYDQIVEIFVTAAVEIFNAEGIVSIEAEMVDFVRVGSNIVEVGMNTIRAATIAGIFIDKIS